ncbi:MAG: DUF433 domain-containing protein [Phycisphaerae bacterium]
MIPDPRHPYVEKVEGRCGGQAVIEGSRIPVWIIVEWYRSGLTAEEILAHYPQLTLSRIFDALGYFDDNRQEIEEDVAANRPPETMLA